MCPRALASGRRLSSPRPAYWALTTPSFSLLCVLPLPRVQVLQRILQNGSGMAAAAAAMAGSAPASGGAQLAGAGPNVLNKVSWRQAAESLHDAVVVTLVIQGASSTMSGRCNDEN